MKVASRSRLTTILFSIVLLFIFSSGFSLGFSGLEIPWWSMDIGGGQISGGDFTVYSTLGQPDAGTLDNGDFAVNGGFLNRLEILQGINFASGWNLISSYVNPYPSEFNIIFKSLNDPAFLCKNNAGQIYWPNQDINQIGTWDETQGYLCHLPQGQTVSLTGPLIPVGEGFKIGGPAWNMIAYWRNVPLPIEDALAACDDEIYIAKNGAGEVYWPIFQIDQIGTMQPGEGYQVYATASCQISYPES